jgi:SRSO17 transposase
MLPFVGVPKTIAEKLASYRDLFCRAAGFKHVSRYITGLLLSDNKTLQGIYAQQVPESGTGTSRRAMHAAVFEAGWDSEGLMERHRTVIAPDHQGRGREVISLDWTLSHHERNGTDIRQTP